MSQTAIALRHWQIADDCLQIGGRPLTEVAAELGQTPFYAYDRALLNQRVMELRAILPKQLELHYAIKANPMPALVRHMVGLVDGLDVASARELGVALEAGGNPADISFAGPGKRDAELRAAVEAGVLLNIESENELKRALAIAGKLGREPRIAIRVNPDFELKSSGMKMGGGPRQFGIDAEIVPAVLGRTPEAHRFFEGFHIFSGSQNLKAEAIVEAQEKTLELATRLAGEVGIQPHSVNIGGGLGIPYFPSDKPLELDALRDHLKGFVDKADKQLPGTRLVMELGRFLVGEAGIYVCRIIDRKVSRGQVFLVTDGGMHQHLAASGNFGQVIRKNYPVIIGNRVEGKDRETASVVGPLCTPLDLLADRANLARADVGDLVVVMQSGAYGLTASPLGFLSHPEPVEVLL